MKKPQQPTNKVQLASKEFQSYYAKKKKLVEEKIQSYCKSLVKKQAASKETHPKQIAQAMNYSLLAGGKRLRAILCMMSYELLDILYSKRSDSRAAMARTMTRQQALGLALGIEMIHSYSLIHDDLPAMDDDDWRRGKAASHKAFGEALAILAGDALLTEAFSVIAKNSATTALIAYTAKAAGIVGMLGGQVIDIRSEKLQSRQELQNMHEMKTGALIRLAAMLPFMQMSLEHSAMAKHMQSYALSLGLLFQITDDILDFTQSKEVLGKTPGSDKKNMKKTYLSFMSIEEAYTHAAKVFSKAQKAIFKMQALILKNNDSLNNNNNIKRKALQSLAYFQDLAAFVYSRKF